METKNPTITEADGRAKETLAALLRQIHNGFKPLHKEKVSSSGLLPNPSAAAISLPATAA
jgi:hypothetical protein